LKILKKQGGKSINKGDLVTEVTKVVSTKKEAQAVVPYQEDERSLSQSPQLEKKILQNIPLPLFGKTDTNSHKSSRYKHQ